jgi:hypothetical protein
MLEDPEPPPHPWWVWLLGGISLVVTTAAAVLAVIGPDGSHPARSVAPVAAITRPACDPDKGRAVRQLGATPIDWAREHTATYDPDGTLVTRWDPDPRLPRFRGHEGAVYNHTTTYKDCAIDTYYVQLAQQTPASAALRRARRELPADAQVLWHRRLSECVQYQFTSTILATQLRARGTDFDAANGALVDLVESHLGVENSVTRIRLALNLPTIPRVTAGCFA